MRFSTVTERVSCCGALCPAGATVVDGVAGHMVCMRVRLHRQTVTF